MRKTIYASYKSEISDLLSHLNVNIDNLVEVDNTVTVSESSEKTENNYKVSESERVSTSFFKYFVLITALVVITAFSFSRYDRNKKNAIDKTKTNSKTEVTSVSETEYNFDMTGETTFESEITGITESESESESESVTTLPSKTGGDVGANITTTEESTTEPEPIDNNTDNANSDVGGDNSEGDSGEGGNDAKGVDYIEGNADNSNVILQVMNIETNIECQYIEFNGARWKVNSIKNISNGNDKNTNGDEILFSTNTRHIVIDKNNTNKWESWYNYNDSGAGEGNFSYIECDKNILYTFFAKNTNGEGEDVCCYILKMNNIWYVAQPGVNNSEMSSLPQEDKN